MSTILTERFLRRTLIVIALGGLVLGLLTWAVGRAELANWIWAAGTAPVVVGLLISMIRDLLAGRMGVDAIAFVSMSAAIALGENLAGVVVAVMYAGGKRKQLPRTRSQDIRQWIVDLVGQTQRDNVDILACGVSLS